MIIFPLLKTKIKYRQGDFSKKYLLQNIKYKSLSNSLYIYLI